MNETNPDGGAEAPQQSTSPGPGTHQDGPRVSSDEVRDLTRLRRTVDDKYVAGVAGGIARHLDIDPVIVRVAFVVLTFFGGAGLIVYGACWLLVPEEGSDSAPVGLDARSRTIALIAVGVLAGLAMIGDLFGEGPGGWIAWPLVVLGAIAWIVLTHRDRRRERTAARQGYGMGHGLGHGMSHGIGHGWGGPPPAAGPGGPVGPPVGYQPAPPPLRPRDPRKRGPILFWFTLALVALSLGTLGIADGAGLPVTDSAYPALGLGVVALMLLVGAFFGRAGGLIPIGLILAAVLAISTAVDRVDGDTIRHEPTSASQVQDRYEMGVGEMKVDLTQVADLEGLDGRTIEVVGDVGDIKVLLPEGLDVDLDASISAAGEIRALGHKRSGWNISLSAGQDRGEVAPRIQIDAELDLGAIEVVTR